MKITGKIVFVALFIMAAVGLSACGKTKVDFKEYVSIGASGTDGYGKLSLSVKYDELGLALGVDEEMENLKDAEDMSDVAEALSKGDVLYKLKCNADKTEGLKNGDEIKITAESFEVLEEKFGASFSNTEFTYTVSGLDPVQEIDPFEGVSVSFRGELNYAGYHADIQSPEQYDKLITYKAQMPEIVTAGSTVTVTCEYDEEKLAKAGYVLRADAPTSKEFPIEGIDTYVDSFEALGDETLAEMKEKSISLIKKEYFGANGSYDKIEYMLADRKDIDYDLEEPKGKLVSDIKYESGYFKNDSNGNHIALMFSFKVKDRKTSATVYAVVPFQDVIRKAAGDIYVSYEGNGYANYAVAYLDISVKDIENELVTNEEFVKVN